MLHVLQSPTMQSTLQLILVLHFFDSNLAAHDLPPHEGTILTLRSRVLVPPPQVAEQSVHALQVYSAQSFGQQLVLHCSSSRVG